MALIQQFRPAATVVWRVLRQGLDTAERGYPLFSGPDIGSDEYYAERGYTPSGQRLDTLVIRDPKDIPDYGFIGPMPAAPAIARAENRLNRYVPQGIAAILRSTESRRDSSLPSKSKTRGTNMYRPRRGQRCRPGYKLINGMCVKQ